MTQDPISRQEVDYFILNEIESVPHLEALLIMRGHPDHNFSSAEVGAQLYIPEASATNILKDLERRGLLRSIEGELPRFQYAPGENLDSLILQVEITYRRELVRVANMIHSKASSAVRDFARAFRITKEKP